MPDRVVYLIDKHTKASKGSDLAFITDVQLSELLADGWSIASSIERKAGGVPCTMMVLKSAADARALTVQRVDEDDYTPPRRGALTHPVTRNVPTTVTTRDEYGMPQEMSLQQVVTDAMAKMARGLTNLGEHPGHLGAPGNHNLPGMTIVSGYHVARAFDLGMIAAKAGHPESSNPWPGTAPGMKWMQGYRSAQRATDDLPQQAADECYREGKATAKSLGPNDDAVCPYPSPAKKAAWLRGFVDGGGVVE